MFRRSLRHPQRELLSFLKPSAIVRLLEWLSYRARNLPLADILLSCLQLQKLLSHNSEPVLF
jgi:hypothetical protein